MTALARPGAAPVAAFAAWSGVATLAVVVGTWLRARGLDTQIVIDDEWHALHKLMRADMLEIVTHLDYADYSIPWTVYLRWLHDHGGVTEWGMRAPSLVAGVLLVALVPVLARRWTSPAVGAAWALLLAVSPLLVQWSRTARPYALSALLGTIAIVAFHRWWHAGRRRDSWAAVYAGSTFLAGWLHMTTLAFTLLPIVFYGVLAWRTQRDALRPLLTLVMVTAIPLALVLLPPVANDWFMFTAKAGVDSPTWTSLYRSVLQVAGTPHVAVAALLAACMAAGTVSFWRRDRLLAAYLLVVMAGGMLAVLAARPNWVQHPPVLTRYLAPIIPLLLLLAAEGLIAIMPRRRITAQAAVVVVATIALWGAGPLARSRDGPDQFTNHLRHTFDYDDAHNPYVQQAPLTKLSPFYRELSQLPPGSVTLIEAPWRLESHFNPHVWYQARHRQHLMIGLVTPVCGTWAFGEYPETYDGIRLQRMAHLSALLRGDTYGADYLVLHLKPWSTPPGARVDWPDIEACLPRIEEALGAPVFRDDAQVVFRLKARTPRIG